MHGFKTMLAVSVMAFFMACTDKAGPQKLPIIGERQGLDAKGDTIYVTIPPFSFINQDGDSVSQKDFEGKVYVSDFFFTHCPTICPKVTTQMLRVHDAFKDDDRLRLISHSIDVKNDTVARLKYYASKLGVNAPKWQFITGDEDKIYDIAQFYFSVAKKDPNTPGGFDHSGRLILVDSKKRVRSFCDGTNPDEVERFMSDIELLLAEEAQSKQ